MDWKVQGSNKGVIGSFFLSRINSTGGVSASLKSNKELFCGFSIAFSISCANFEPIGLLYSYLITGLAFKDNNKDVKPSTVLFNANPDHEPKLSPYILFFGIFMSKWNKSLLIVR
ncbi:hypothetical protein WICPIJ_002986 [Wickerhamomyces pijperi]|uniref:Uncharacterized protein n=1 Tax=Wickerhamomyces pijperi TaxID=599730 RepID=A0A9P8Q8J7_WICPI|nr:hypothetical protein WICPIJ_002986 [Wickerhamomyces pijperi]